ncbi:hypothetical protein BH09ACT7_BH09ACT7_37530 [soil metagenome]
MLAPARRPRTTSTDFTLQIRRRLKVIDEPTELDLYDLLGVLGYIAGECVSISHDNPRWNSRVVAPKDAPAALAEAPDGANSYFGVSPIRGRNRTGKGRGTTSDVTRLSALIADLDFKKDGCGSLETAHAVIDDLSVIVGTRPSAITSSGGGLHPYYPISDGQIGESFTTADATKLLDRWGTLVGSVAKKHGAKVDGVFDLPRVLRAPGSYNYRSAKPVTCVSDTGRALTVSDLDAALRSAGALTEPTGTRVTEEVATSDPSTWQFADDTCSYVRKWLDTLPTDGPNGSGRHQWVASQAVRLGCARRAGCISKADDRRALKMVKQRLVELRSDPGETVPDIEVPSLWKAGLKKAAEKTDAEVAAELGNHTHIPGHAYFTDAGMSEVVAAEVLSGAFLKSTAGNWHQWNGKVWQQCTDGPPTEATKQFVLSKIASVAKDLASDPANQILLDRIAAWKKFAAGNRITAVLKLAANQHLIAVDADKLDADRELLNTPTGIVDLRTGQRSAHDPAQLMTRITRGAYRPGYVHPDVTKALTALPKAEREWFQRVIGVAITGHPTPEGVVPILFGTGSNGKTALTTGGLVAALGGYATPASAKLFASSKHNNEHSTEIADLNGRRLVVGEELTEDRSLNMTALKRITDVSQLKARFVRKDNAEFSATHSLLLSTNYQPAIAETDHGTWRRLALVKFPYTFHSDPRKVVAGTDDRPGDGGLKERLRDGEDGQHDAFVTWAVEGAVAWYASPTTALLPTARIKADTLAWRAGADRILGFWAEHLVADPDGKILVSDMLTMFNQWLTENGHSQWAKETFTPRFSEHSETRQHSIERKKTRNLDGLSRPSGWAKEPAKGMLWMWQGVRWRRSADDAAEELSFPPVPVTMTKRRKTR